MKKKSKDQRGDDRGDEPAAATAEDRGREHREHEDERRVRSLRKSERERDHQPGERQRAADRDDPTEEADLPLWCEAARLR